MCIVVLSFIKFGALSIRLQVTIITCSLYYFISIPRTDKLYTIRILDTCQNICLVCHQFHFERNIRMVNFIVCSRVNLLHIVSNF